MQVFQARNKNNASSEDDTEVEDEKSVQSNHFVQNPAELRANAEQRRQLREDKNAHNVNGKLQIYRYKCL